MAASLCRLATRRTCALSLRRIPAALAPLAAQVPAQVNFSSDATQPPFPVTTKECLEHYDIVQEIGVVSGGDVRTKNLFKDILSAITGMFGGETTHYSHLLNESSAASMDKLVDHAMKLDADAVVGIRFNTAATMNRLIVGLHSLVMVYGTAVKLEPKNPSVDPYGIRFKSAQPGHAAADRSPLVSMDGEGVHVPQQSKATEPRGMSEEAYSELIMRSGSAPAKQR